MVFDPTVMEDRSLRKTFMFTSNSKFRRNTLTFISNSKCFHYKKKPFFFNPSVHTASEEFVCESKRGLGIEYQMWYGHTYNCNVLDFQRNPSNCLQNIIIIVSK